MKIIIEVLSGWMILHAALYCWNILALEGNPKPSGPDDRVTLGLCLVCCGRSISFAFGWRARYKAYLLMPCLVFSSACVYHSLFTLSTGFSYEVDWIYNIPYILLCEKKAESNIVLRFGQFTLQPTICRVEQRADKGTDASPWGTFSSYGL